MKKLLKIAFFIAIVLFLSVPSPGGAQEIGGKVHTVVEGETLLDIAQTDEVMVLAIKILNDLENPLELKTGSKVILPDAAFINEITTIASEDLETRAEEYRARISSTLMAELDASYVDPKLQKNMGNLAELPKPVDVNPGFFQGVMPAFKPMYGFIGASLDTSLAALEETWNSPQNTPSSYFQTSLGAIPNTSQRAVSTTVAMSASGKLPKNYNTGKTRTSTSNGNKTTTKSSTYNPASTSAPNSVTQSHMNSKDINAALAAAAQKAAATAGKSVKEAAAKVLANASAAADKKSSYTPPPTGSRAYSTVYGSKTETAGAKKSSGSSSSTDWGSIAGGVAGGVAGGMVGGVVGAVAGATLGSKIANGVGKTVGSIASKLKFW